ncbi:thioredoxin family protein [Shewanella sp.]|uniref:thioredoxin family protein n=1 Tax=Shewanella sp. TaxID=50422 RepID=UPI004047D6ED
MEIKILGTGCTKCQKLTETTVEAVKALGVDVKVLKVTDVAKIMEYNVMSTPALVVDDKVVLSGRLASVDEVVSLLQAYI